MTKNIFILTVASLFSATMAQAETRFVTFVQCNTNLGLNSNGVNCDNNGGSGGSGGALTPDSFSNWKDEVNDHTGCSSAPYSGICALDNGGNPVTINEVGDLFSGVADLHIEKVLAEDVEPIDIYEIYGTIHVSAGSHVNYLSKVNIVNRINIAQSVTDISGIADIESASSNIYFEDYTKINQKLDMSGAELCEGINEGDIFVYDYNSSPIAISELCE